MIIGDLKLLDINDNPNLRILPPNFSYKNIMKIKFNSDRIKWPVRKYHDEIFISVSIHE